MARDPRQVTPLSYGHQIAPFLAITQLLSVLQEVEALAHQVEELRTRLNRLEADKRQLSQPLLDTKAAARVLGVSPRTLEGWRLQGKGPPYIGGRPVLYRRDELETWQADRKVGA